MGSSPTTTNQAASVVNDVLKAIIEGAGVPEVEAAILLQAPWLGLPFIKQFFEWGLNWVASYFYVSAANAATKIVIDVQVNMEQSNVIQSFQNLQMAIASGDQKAIEQASLDLDKSYGALIHSDGAAPA
jgi:hypothetical protein